MKVIYVDTNQNTDYYINGVPTLKVRLVFRDDGDIFVYYTEDTEHKAYINRVLNHHLKPNIFDIHNLLPIEDDEQYERYDKKIQDLFNYQAIHAGERVDGSDEIYKDDPSTKIILGS